MQSITSGKWYVIFISILGVFALWNCAQPSEYQQLVQRELATGIRNDSLILGYTFGMSRDDFYKYSWEINKQGLVVNGSGAEIVEEVHDLKAPAKRSFYPKFKDETIVQLPIEYYYNGWAPWNRNLFADSLLYDLKDYIQDTYGGSFISKIDSASGKPVFVQVSGNREIRLYELTEQRVMVQFTDLSRLTMEF